MSKISDKAWEVAGGQSPAPNIIRGACLSNARQIADKALGFQVYGRYPPGHDRAFDGPTAQTAETAWTNQGLSVPVTDLQAGDFVFQPFSYSDGRSPGHVGIYLGQRNGIPYVLENTTATRGQVVGGNTAIRLTPLANWGGVRTVIRFPQDTKIAADRGNVTAAAQGNNPTATMQPPASTVSPSPPGTPLAAVGISETGEGTLQIGTVEAHYREDPEWLFNTLDAYKDVVPSGAFTNFGAVRGIVILRNPLSDDLQQAIPFVGPMMIAGKRILEEAKKQWNTTKDSLKKTEAWGKYYAPLMEVSVNPDRGAYRYPLPDVTSISYRQEVNGNAVAEIEMHISEAREGEMVFATLTMAAQLKNAFCEVWLPMSYYDSNQKGSEGSILYPAFVGMIEEVSANPYPHGIRFRVVPQDHYINQRGIDPADQAVNSWPPGTPIWQIIEQISKDSGIKFFTPSAPRLQDLKQMEQTFDGEYNALYRPPMDVVRELVERTAGLRLSRLAGFDLLGKTVGPFKAIWMIYDPLGFHPFTKGFWENQLWKQLISPVAKALTGAPNLVGEISVFYPEAIVDDMATIKKMAQILDTYASDEARAKPWRKLIDNLSATLKYFGIGSGPAVKAAIDGQAKTALIEAINDWFASDGEDRTPTQKWLIPTLAVEDMTVRTPTEAELANPVFGTPYGASGQRGVAVDASKAANIMQIQQSQDGTFSLQTPNGVEKFERKDKVYMYYAANMSRPSSVVPVNRQAEVASAEGKFFPYTVTLRCKPTHGVRVGGMAVMIGHGRLDGLWEIHGVAHTLTGSSQELIVTLRTARAIFLV